MRRASATTPTLVSRRPAALVARAAGILVVSAVAMFGVIAPASAVTKLSQSAANTQFANAGISHSSSGNCTTRTNTTCTSYEQINQNTVNGGITLHNASGCAVNITGGTEDGHAGGQTGTGMTHWNGYKIDISKYTCIGSYIKGSFTQIANRGDGYPQWRSAAGNTYCDEGSHWDITYI